MDNEQTDSEASEAISEDTTPEVDDQQDAPPEVTDQDTPAAVLRKMYSAAMDDDKEPYLECFRSPKRYQEFLDGHYGFYVFALRFKTKLEKVFGRKGSQRFEDMTTLEPKATLFWTPPLDKSVHWWESIQCDISGDNATCMDPYKRREWSMTKRAGVWQIDLSTYRSLHGHAADYRKFKTAVEKCIQEIDKPGMTVDGIRKRLGELMSIL